MLPQLGQRDVVHHGKVGVNKAATVVQNTHVQWEVLLTLRLGISLLGNILGHHAEDEFNLVDIPLWCCSGPLEKFLRPTTLLFPINIIMCRY